MEGDHTIDSDGQLCVDVWRGICSAYNNLFSVLAAKNFFALIANRYCYLFGHCFTVVFV